MKHIFFSILCLSLLLVGFSVDCPFSNVAVVVFAAAADFPMMYFTLTTLSRFMLCSNKIHLVIDTADVPASMLWFAENMGRHIVQLHSFPLPEIAALKAIGDGREKSMVSHHWGKFWADTFVEKDSGADFIMFMDVDSILAMPMSCKSMFNEKGLPHYVSVPWNADSKAAKSTCEQWTGGACDRSFAATIPFLMPLNAFEPLRTFVRSKLHPEADSFDGAFQHWLSNNKGLSLQPHQIMGEYMYREQSTKIHSIHCPAWPVHFGAKDTPAEVEACASYVPPGLYYDKPVQERLKLGADKEFEAATYVAQPAPGLETVYGSRFALPTMPLLEALVDQGDCIGIYLYRGEVSTEEGCTEATAKAVHKMLDLYHGKRPLPWTKVIDVYAPDTKQHRLCATSSSSSSR